MPASRNAAARFLTQATFGPNDASIDEVMKLGYAGWIDAQWAKPRGSHRANWEASKAANAWSKQPQVLYSFWKQAIGGEDQLRQRVAYALSQIMVTSMMDNNVGNYPRGAASYLDVLADKGLGNYRDLLEAVALHPMMGRYLSSMSNQKADDATGRVPDENFAREVMQLFSIGLYQLNADGTTKRDASGQPIPTYTPSDIAGIAKVFTGWSWRCATTDATCFRYGRTTSNVFDANRDYLPMQAYPSFHSTESKTFLGTTIPAQSSANPAADLKVALDVLFKHPNVGPFIGRQLIQRLVTSNPSPAYVAAVAAAFANNGAGVRGDMRAVVKAVLMHPEARVSSATQGKVREPVLRLSAYARAFNFRSDSGEYRIGITDDPATQIGQTPLRAQSVFNFYRPGYVPPGTESGSSGLAVPELQIASETSAAGYVNFMRDVVSGGVGAATNAQRDVRGDYSGEWALTTNPSALVDRINAKLMYGTMPAALKTEIVTTISKVAIPAPYEWKGQTNQPLIDKAKRARLQAALLLTVASPEYQVQK